MAIAAPPASDGDGKGVNDGDADAIAKAIADADAGADANADADESESKKNEFDVTALASEFHFSTIILFNQESSKASDIAIQRMELNPSLYTHTLHCLMYSMRLFSFG